MLPVLMMASCDQYQTGAGMNRRVAVNGAIRLWRAQRMQEWLDSNVPDHYPSYRTIAMPGKHGELIDVDVYAVEYEMNPRDGVHWVAQIMYDDRNERPTMVQTIHVRHDTLRRPYIQHRVYEVLGNTGAKYEEEADDDYELQISVAEDLMDSLENLLEDFTYLLEISHKHEDVDEAETDVDNAINALRNFISNAEEALEEAKRRAD